MDINEGKILIDGKWQNSSSGKTLPVIDPSDGKKIGFIARGSQEDIKLAVKSAQKALDGEWGKIIP